MKKKIVLLAFLSMLLSTALFLCFVGWPSLQMVYASPYTDISVETAYDMITSGCYPDLVVLDVRTQDEYDSKHICGAVLIPYTELEARIGELAGHENHEIIVYCKLGGRSAIASGILDSHGFTKVYNMLGGINAWESAGYPVAQGGLSYLVVRGLNNRIYYRSYTSSSDSWDNWNVVSTGLTCDSPATAVCCGRLHIVVRGFSKTNIYANYSLWHGWINLTDNTFSGWTKLSGKTPSAPTLVCHDPQLILVVRGLDNRIYYRSYDCVLEAWEGWTALPNGATSDSPATTTLGDELQIVVRGFSATNVYGNRSLWHGFVNLTTGVFSGWTRLPGMTSSTPTLTSSECAQTLDMLYLVVRGLDNRIYYNTWNGSQWEGWTSLPNGTTCDSPATTTLGDELQIVVRGMDGATLWHYHINLSMDDHSGWNRISGKTPSAPTLTS